MTDYNSLKVGDLKKLLSERSLQTSGVKTELIARLQKSDPNPSAASAPSAPPAAPVPAPTAAPPAPAAATGDDEIDWDEDEAKATTEPAAAAIAAGGQGPVDNPVAVPNQILDVDPATTSDLSVANTGEAATDSAPAAEAEKPKLDFSIGIQQTDAEKEAEKRAARAKRFGVVEDDEEKKKAERARKFGTDAGADTAVLDAALPERRPKRGRNGVDQAEPAAKRQTPDPKAAAPKTAVATKGPVAPKEPIGKILDDPAEKAKAEARAKRFQT